MMKFFNIRMFVVTSLMLLFTASWANETSDKLQFSSETLVPGETEAQYVNLTLLGSRLYSGYNVEIAIPEGVEPAYEDDELDLQKGEILKNSHTVAGEYDTNTRVLRVICSSSSNADFRQTFGVVCRIGVVVSTYAKPGALSLALSGQALTTKDMTEYDPADVTDENVTIGTIAKASLSVSSANKWSTCILPFAAALPDGLKAYSCSSKNDDEQVFYLSDATSIEAYTPYVLYSESGYTGTLTGEVDASNYPESGKVAAGYLTGAVKAQTTNEGYILQKLNGVVKFYLADPSKTYSIPAGRCWATPPTGSAQSYGFALEPTAVKSVAETSGSKSEYKYDLNGIIIGAPKDGQMYIQNGKKIIK